MSDPQKPPSGQGNPTSPPSAQDVPFSVPFAEQPRRRADSPEPFSSTISRDETEQFPEGIHDHFVSAFACICNDEPTNLGLTHQLVFREFDSYTYRS